MKKIISMFSLLFLTQLVFGQSHQIAQVSSMDQFKAQILKNHTYVFNLVESTNAENIKEASSYYVDYFKVNFNAIDNSIAVTLNGKHADETKIMRRLFASLNIENIKVGGEELSTDKFFLKYIYSTDHPNE